MQLYKNFCEEKFDENGVLSEFKLNYPENYNFGYDVVDEMAKKEPSARALVWCNPKGEERIFTFKEISELSSKAANVFRAHGIKKGDKVLVILKRSWEYWYCVPALHKIGAVVIPATHMLTVNDISYRLKTAQISAAVCSQKSGVCEKLLEAQKSYKELTNIFAVDGGSEGIIDLASEVEAASSELERIPTLASEPMLIYFTSGTTGYPKAVMHNHTYTLSHIVTARHWQCVRENGLHFTIAETGWGKASWGKIYGQWLCGCAVMVYDFDIFSPGAILSIIEKYGVTTFCAPPTVYRYFAKKDISHYDLSSLEHITTAGEALNPEVFNNIKEQTGLEIMEGFGQTETSLLLANLENSVPKPGSMGKPSPMYNIKIVDEDGNPVAVGDVGEIVVDNKGREYGIFMGYGGDDELYGRVWRGDVYHTGDTAYYDKNGYYYYVGRADDIIKTSGFRVGPFEIENILMEHPAVLECAITGVPDKDRGQAIKATVVLNKGYKGSTKLEKEIQTFCNKRVSSYKRIQYLEFVSEMPKTISGKIRHSQLRKAVVKPYKRDVNYYETDKMNIVHHSNYFRYFEEARMDFMKQIGCGYDELEEKGMIIPNIDATAKYIHPLHYGDSFEVRVKLAEFNGVKVCFEYDVRHDGETVCTGITTHCFVNSRFRPMSIKKAYPEIYEKFNNLMK